MIRHLSHIFFVEALTFINTWVIIDSIDFRGPTQPCCGIGRVRRTSRG